MAAEQQLVFLPNGIQVRQWRIQQLLGKGSFGAVYRCSDTQNPTSQTQFALKTEGNQAQLQVLGMEVTVLDEIRAHNIGRHFCQILDRGTFQNFNYVVMTLVGESLHDLRKVRYSRHNSGILNEFYYFRECENSTSIWEQQ